MFRRHLLVWKAGDSRSSQQAKPVLSCCAEVGDIRAEAAFVLSRNEMIIKCRIKMMAGCHGTEGAGLTTKDGLGVPWHRLNMNFGSLQDERESINFCPHNLSVPFQRLTDQQSIFAALGICLLTQRAKPQFLLQSRNQATVSCWNPPLDGTCCR